MPGRLAIFVLVAAITCPGLAFGAGPGSARALSFCQYRPLQQRGYHAGSRCGGQGWDGRHGAARGEDCP